MLRSQEYKSLEMIIPSFSVEP